MPAEQIENGWCWNARTKQERDIVELAVQGHLKYDMTELEIEHALKSGGMCTADGVLRAPSVNFAKAITREGLNVSPDNVRGMKNVDIAFRNARRVPPKQHMGLVYAAEVWGEKIDDCPALAASVADPHRKLVLSAVPWWKIEAVQTIKRFLPYEANETWAADVIRAQVEGHRNVYGHEIASMVWIGFHLQSDSVSWDHETEIPALVECSRFCVTQQEALERCCQMMLLIYQTWR